MLRAVAEEDKKDYYETMIKAKASVLDSTDSEQVEQLNKLMEAYANMISPETQKKKEEEGKQMEQMFKSMFGDSDIPQPIELQVGEPVNNKAQFKDKSIKDLAN